MPVSSRRLRPVDLLALLATAATPLACGFTTTGFGVEGSGGLGGGSTTTTEAPCMPGSQRSCYSGPAGTEGVGLCKPGTQACNAEGTGYGSCDGEIRPIAEDCTTTTDENCDGQVNDGCACKPGETGPCYSGPPGTEGVGPCEGGTHTCQADATWGACTGETLPSTEDCTTPEDEDCDGHAFDDTDDGCACDPSMPTVACDTTIPGICAAGTQTCSADGKTLSVCVQTTPASLFDDCATVEDEDCDGVSVCTGTPVAGAPIAAVTGDDVVFAAAADASGNLLVGGVTGGTAVGFSVTGGTMLVAKYDPTGAVLWTKSLGTGGHAVARSLAADAAGNVIVVGHFAGTLDFGNGVAPLISNDAGADTDVVVAKLDPNGNALWAKRFGNGGNAQYGYGVAVDAGGNAVVVGAMSGSIDFGGGNLNGAGGLDAFAAKLDPNGGHVWSRLGGFTQDQVARGVALTPQGDAIVVGAFSGNIGFGGAAVTSAGANDVFVVRLSAANGQRQWLRPYGDALDQGALAVTVDGKGDIAVVGDFRGTVDFGNGHSFTNSDGASDDAFVVKLAGDGASSSWGRAIAGDASVQHINAVAFDGAGHVLLGGHFWGTVNFGGADLVNGGDPATGTSDAFAAKLDGTTGAHIWSRRFGDVAGEQRIRAVATDPDGNSIVAGAFIGSIDFGAPVGALSGAGGYDAFAVKLGP